MIKRLMELGVMVDPEAAKLLEGGDADRITAKITKLNPMPFTINAELARKLLSEPAQPKLLRKIQPMAGMSVPDFSAAYGERYSTLQRLLLKNPALANAVSVTSASGECSIIGMVKNKGTAIEDPSGEGAFSSDAKLLDGDVIGAVGTAAGGIFRAREIVFPGVQLKERAVSSGTLKAGGCADCQIRTDATGVYSVNGLTVAVSHTKLAKEETLELLKRRHLTVPPKDWLEPQPDMLIANSAENFTENYKGVTVIGIKEGSTAEVDLNTRETVFK